jgi:3-deoxy-D-manno-octulosonic-acid transferase
VAAAFSFAVNSMLRAVYSLTLALATPLIVARLLWRSIRQPAYRLHWRERFGFPSSPPLASSIWIHAVSVGEMRATQPLVRRLQQDFPALPIIVTCMTPTGRETATELYGSAVTCVYLPYDFAVFHKQLIARFNPRAVLIMETEIWPNLLAACASVALPALLVNARMSEKSTRGYLRFAPVRHLINNALKCLRVVAAQTPEDAQRLNELGAVQTTVTGNMKFDMPVGHAATMAGIAWRDQLHGSKRNILLAASTRDGEEAMLLDAYLAAFAPDERCHLLLVVVPRHPQRFDAVSALLRDSGLRFNRRSSNFPQPDDEAWLGDSMGEMAAYIAMADMVFIGGSLLPLGGHNLIEACAQGKPVLMGPSTFNFADASRLAIEAGAMLQARDAADLMKIVRVLLQDEAMRKTMSRAALAFAGAHAGATNKTMGLIAPLLDARK